MRAALEALIVVAGAAGAAAAIAALARAKAGRRARWAVAERSDPTGDVVVELRKPGETALEVARVPASLDAVNFSDRLAEARAEARSRAASLNAGGHGR